MNLGVFAKTFKRGSVGAIFKAIKQAGYSCAQFNMACVGMPSFPSQVDDLTIKTILHEAAHHGVALSALSGTFNMAHPLPEVRADGLKSLEVLGSVCSRLHIPVLTLCTGTRDPGDMWRGHPENTSKQAKADFRRSLEGALSIAEANDLFLAIEPEPGNVIDSARTAWQLIQDVKSTRIKIILDPANLIKARSAAEDRLLIEEACRLLGDRIAMAHAKDRNKNGDVCRVGKGVVDFPHFLNCLDQIGFGGPLIAHGMEEPDAAAVAAYLRTTLLKQGEEAHRAAI